MFILIRLEYFSRLDFYNKVICERLQFKLQIQIEKAQINKNSQDFLHITNHKHNTIRPTSHYSINISNNSGNHQDSLSYSNNINKIYLLGYKNKMSSNQQQQQQLEIMQACQQINQALEIPQQQFSLQSLTHVQWYLVVLQMIYPQLGRQFDTIRRIEDEGMAIDKLLLMLASEEIIEEDFLQIKGSDIVEGDIESVYYIVQLLSALIKRETEEEQIQEEQQKDQQVQSEGELEQQQQQESQKQQHQYLQQQTQSKQYSRSFEPSQPTSPQKQPQQLSKKYLSGQPAQNQQNQPLFKHAFNHYDSQDQPSQQEERHSVLGIRNQFEDQEQYSEEDDQSNDQNIKKHRPIGAGNSDTLGQANRQNINFQPFGSNTKQLQQQQVSPYPYQQKTLNPQKNQVNIFDTNFQSKLNQQQLSSNEFISTKNAYKQQPQPQSQPQSQSQLQVTRPVMQKKKQFSSSEEEDTHFYEEQNIFQNKQKGMKAKQESQQEDDNEYYINPTIKKYKSDTKLQNVGSGSKKTTSKKQRFQSPFAKIIDSKQTKKLVTHPTIKKQYQKATNPQARKLTHEVKMNVTSTLKKKSKKGQAPSTIVVKTTMEEMQRKKRQLKVKLTDYAQSRQLLKQYKTQSQTQQAKSSMQLGKILNWRQGQLRKQKQEFQKGMQMKLQVQKEKYIKKINNLVIKLQKEKQLDEKQLYKEKLYNQNQQAAKRLTAIEQWYKDRIVMLKQKNVGNRNQRTLMHTGHKEILKQIEKQLKRENQKQVVAITMKYRKQEAEIENDLELLERELVKVYKRN